MSNSQSDFQVAVIREAECIGCTKCLAACPVDAILGAAKHMHTVITDECIGCRLCIQPCPVDCIDMVAITALTPEERQIRAEKTRGRYQAHSQRLKKLNELKTVPFSHRQAEIAAAVERTKKLKAP